MQKTKNIIIYQINSKFNLELNSIINSYYDTRTDQPNNYILNYSYLPTNKPQSITIANIPNQLLKRIITLLSTHNYRDYTIYKYYHKIPYNETTYVKNLCLNSDVELINSIGYNILLTNSLEISTLIRLRI